MQYNELCHNGFGTKAKRILAMNELYNYVDICLIDEYANKDFDKGYSLDIDDLSEDERENFLNQLMKYDTAARDLMRYHMQQLINKRLPIREEDDYNFKISTRRKAC